MAERAGVSEATVRRVWHAHGLKPHLSRTRVAIATIDHTDMRGSKPQ